MLTALDRALAVYCAHSRLDTHCTARKKTPAVNNISMISTSILYAGQQEPGSYGEPSNIADGDFVVGNITECS